MGKTNPLVNVSTPLIIVLKDDSWWPLGHLISQAVPNWPDESGNSLNELDSFRTTLSSAEDALQITQRRVTSLHLHLVGTIRHWPSWHDINSSWNIECSRGSSEYNLLSETMEGFGVHAAKEKCSSLHWCLGNISASRQLLSCLSLLEYCLSVFPILVHHSGFSKQSSFHLHQISCAYNINYEWADEQFAFSCGWRVWWRFLGPGYPATLSSNLYVMPPYLQMASTVPTSAGVYMLGKVNQGAPPMCMWIQCGCSQVWHTPSRKASPHGL